MVDTPFPVEGTITPKETGYRASIPCASEWLTQTETGDYLQQAVDRAARKYGNGVEVRVRFESRDGLQCTSYQLLGEVPE